MRCGRCKKNFDEQMYSGICPKCGYFNNRQTEYDVSKYISATFDDGGKTSTSEQAAKQHEQLHRAYDSVNMHKKGAGSHEQLHRMYDSVNMHGQAQRPTPGNQQVSVNRQGVSLGKENPYQTSLPGMSGRTFQAGKTAFEGNKYGKAGAPGEEKKKNLVTPVCILIAVLAIAGTVAACQLKKQSLEKAYYTLDFEKETMQAGEPFELNERRVVVNRARVVDTSALYGMPKGEKLVAVSIDIVPVKERVDDDVSGEVYASDGSFFKMPLEDYSVLDIVYDGDYSKADDILSRYSFYGYIPADGRSGDCYFFVKEDAGEITVSFEEGNDEDGLYALQRRVSVSLQIEEGAEDE